MRRLGVCVERQDVFQSEEMSAQGFDRDTAAAGEVRLRPRTLITERQHDLGDGLGSASTSHRNPRT
jgi:hypothetical protein